jgi:hypothetical protein
MSAPIWYDSAETGAPSLNNAAGSLLALMRAVLRDGFNVKAVTSITVASGVATVICPTHGYSSAFGKWVKITGANVSALDGVKQQTIVNANTFTYPAPGVADGSYTATDARRAPLGWTEPFTGTNKAIFSRPAPEAGTQLLRILDTAAAPAATTDARVLMLESATDIDTFVNPSPSATQMTDGAGGYIHKGANSATVKPWALVGDDRGFYFIGPNNAATPGETDRLGYWFGDGVPFFPGDAHFCLLSVNSASGGAAASSKVGVGATVASNWAAAAPQASVVARSRDGSVVSPIFDCQGPFPARYGSITAMSAGMPEKLYLMQGAHVVDNNATKEVRGLLPALAAPVANMPFAGLGAVSVIGPAEGDGRYYLAVNARAGGSVAGNFVIDISGPWYG